MEAERLIAAAHVGCIPCAWTNDSLEVEASRIPYVSPMALGLPKMQSLLADTAPRHIPLLIRHLTIIAYLSVLALHSDDQSLVD